MKINTILLHRPTGKKFAYQGALDRVYSENPWHVVQSLDLSEHFSNRSSIMISQVPEFCREDEFCRDYIEITDSNKEIIGLLYE